MIKIISDLGNKNPAAMFKTYHLSVDNNHFLDLYHDGRIIAVKLYNVNTKIGTVFDVEIHKDSGFFTNLVTALKEISNEE